MTTKKFEARARSTFEHHTPHEGPKPIPVQMWRDLCHAKMCTSDEIAFNIYEGRHRIVRVGERYGFTEQDMIDQNLLRKITPELEPPSGEARHTLKLAARK